jgi:hypothetical protein
MKRALVMFVTAVTLTGIIAPQGTAARVTLETVPRLKGIAVALDGRVYRTGHGGRVVLNANGPLRGRLEVRDTQLPGRVKATFARWYGNLDRRRPLIKAALDLHYPVRWRFTDLDGDPLPFGRVASISFKSSHGRVHKFEREDWGRRHWFQGSRVVSTPEGPRNKDLYYTVEKVIVDGSNVVNRAQQRFEPAHRRDLAVKLLFYSAEFSAHDALFKFGIGRGIKLTFPNGEVKRYAFGPGAKLRLDRLPRGEYWVVVDAPGMSFLRPVSLSRNQHVPLEVLSWIDIGFVIGVVFAIALGLLVLGRPWLLRYTQLATYRGYWAAFRTRSVEEASS